MPKAITVNKFVSTLAIASMLVSGPVSAKEVTASAGDVAELEKNIPECNPANYDPKTKPVAACTSCQTDIKNSIKGVTETYPKAVSATKAADTTGILNSSNAGAADNSEQKVAQGSQVANTGGGSTALMSKSNAASSLATAAKSCSSSLQGKCSGLAAADEQKAKKVLESCDKIAKDSATTAAEKAGGGLDMASLAQLAGAAMQAMAALKPSPSPSATESGLTSSKDPTQTSTVPENAASSSLGSENQKSANSVGIGENGNATGTSIGNNPKAGSSAGGFAPSYAAQSFEPELDRALGGSSTDGFEGGSPSVAGGASSAGGGGTSGGDSTGSSKMGSAEDAAARAAAAAAAEAAYEVPGGGGGGRPAFLGLKSKSGDSDLEGEAPGSGVLGELGLEEEGGRGLASDEGHGDGIAAEDGMNLFKVIHSKYAEIKKRGNI